MEGTKSTGAFDPLGATSKLFSKSLLIAERGPVAAPHDQKWAKNGSEAGEQVRGRFQ